MAEQEQTLDLQAMMKAKEHMGEFAGRTVGLGLVVGFIFFAVLLGFVTNYVPFFVALIFLSFATYAIYTVMHDAVHRSIQGERRDLSWLNEGLGYLAGQVLMIPFTVHRRSHLAHHAHTNEDKEDPDFSYHKAGKSIGQLVYLAARTGFDQYAYYVNNCWSKASRGENAKVVAETVIAVAWRIGIVLYGASAEVLVLLVLSGVLGSMITIYFFAYLVHQPYDAIGRWVDTNTYVFRQKWGGMIDWLWLFQNYHAIHHLYPRVPFYRYRQLFDDIEEVMIAKNSPISYQSSASASLGGLTSK